MLLVCEDDCRRTKDESFYEVIAVSCKFRLGDEAFFFLKATRTNDTAKKQKAVLCSKAWSDIGGCFSLPLKSFSAVSPFSSAVGCYGVFSEACAFFRMASSMTVPCFCCLLLLPTSSLML